MSLQPKAWLLSALPLTVFAVLAWRLPGMLHLSGWPARAVSFALLLLGVAASAVLMLIMRGRAARDTAPAEGADVDEAMTNAATRLAAANRAARLKIPRMPTVLVLGPTGSTKTSIVMHSGLEPELLAGETMRNDVVAPTSPLNVWYAHGTAIVEAGGALMDDAGRWKRLIRHLVPGRLAAAFGRGGQAPRVAVLCFACDDFTRPGAAQNLQTLARSIRARLIEASQQLGVRLPVYVLFTRADRLPYFADYVRNFTHDEAEQVLGATLPLLEADGPAWAEQQTRRLNAAFAAIVRTLAVRRLDVLPRDNQVQTRANVYEFPRELRRIADPAVQLLVDIFRPTQLGMNPFLRGFYFTGVRPVVVRDVADSAGPAAPVALPGGSAATSVFSGALVQQAMQAAMRSTERRVPQWVFLPRLFRDVVLQDEGARRITGGGARVNVVRRGLMAAAVAACVLLVGGMTVSYANNHELITRAGVTAAYASEARSSSYSELTRLDSVRSVAAGVADIDRGSLALRYRWGLYRADDVLDYLRAFHYDRFSDALWNDAYARLVYYLDQLPEQPGPDSDFSRTQRALAAYRMTTDHREYSTAEDLGTALLEVWRDPGTADDVAALARAQFAWFGAELPHGAYPPAPADANLIDHAQDFLLNFGSNVYYDALISSLNTAAPGRYEGTEHVTNPKVVPGAFTFEGMRAIDDALDSVETIFSRYGWLYDGRTPADRPDPAELERRYYVEYVNYWQDYLRQARVVPFGSWSEAAARLSVLGMPQSPLFDMLYVASYHTNMAATHPIGGPFQMLHAIVNPKAERFNAAAGATAYTDALNGLARVAQSAIGATPLPQASSSQQLRSVAGGMVVGEVPDEEAAETAGLLRSLLLQPAVLFDRMLAAAPRDAVNRAGQDFCNDYNRIGRLLPFTSSSTQSANPADVEAILGANGLLAALYNQHLRQYMTENGAQLPGVQSVTGSFQRFYRTALNFRRALFRPDGSQGAEIIFSFEPPPGGGSVTLQIDERPPQTFSAAMRRDMPVSWRPERATLARLTVNIEGREIVVAEGGGPYGLFRMFAPARWRGSGPYEVEWTVPGEQAPLIGSISMSPELHAILARGGLGAMERCAGRILD